MKDCRKFTLLILFTLFLTFLDYSGNFYAQTEKKLSTPPTIKWIDQYPPLNKRPKKSNVAKRLLNLFIGKKKPSLIQPFSLITIKPKSFWVLDQGNRSVLYIEEELGNITQFFRENSLPFPSLIDICAKPDGTILFTDSRLNKIFSLSPASGRPDILNNLFRLEHPTGIAYSVNTGEIWVVETGKHRLVILDQNGAFIRSIGQRGTLPGEFNFPTFIWIDSSGIVYVVDSMNFRVQILNLKGEVISVFGENGDATGYFARPKGIATDSYGHIYVVDALFHTVQVFDREGNFLYNFGQQGSGQGQFWLPVGIYIDENNRIYVADSYNGRIQIFQFLPGTADEN